MVGIVPVLQLRKLSCKEVNWPAKGTELRWDTQVPGCFLCSSCHLLLVTGAASGWRVSLLLRSDVLRLEELSSWPSGNPWSLFPSSGLSRKPLLAWNKSPVFDQEDHALRLHFWVAWEGWQPVKLRTSAWCHDFGVRLPIRLCVGSSSTSWSQYWGQSCW